MFHPSCYPYTGGNQASHLSSNKLRKVSPIHQVRNESSEKDDSNDGEREKWFDYHKKLHLVRPLSILENITAIQMKCNNLKKKSI